MAGSNHQPVLLKEVIEHLNIKKNGVYVDATFGRGGHSRAILQQLGTEGRLLAFDKDPDAIKAALQDPIFQDKRFSVRQGSFSELIVNVKVLNLTNKIDGILLDVGVSFSQLNDPRRGFSFLNEGPLDMRMDPTQGESAAVWIDAAPEQDIMQVLKKYGEERYAKRIARAIVDKRREQPIATTKQLAKIVSDAQPRHDRYKHPATRTFQAIRIFINRELEELHCGLEQSLEILSVGGRLLVISFHSLEDRIVKQFMYRGTKDSFPKRLPIPHTETQSRLRCIGKLIRPKAQEMENNPRSRSAVLRIAEKLA